MPSRPEIAAMRKTHRYQKARAAVLVRDRGICWLCGRPGANTADHVVPLAVGGHPYDMANLRAAHHKCNSRRGASVAERVELDTSRVW